MSIANWHTVWGCGVPVFGVVGRVTVAITVPEAFISMIFPLSVPTSQVEPPGRAMIELPVDPIPDGVRTDTVPPEVTLIRDPEVEEVLKHMSWLILPAQDCDLSPEVAG